MPEEPTRLVPGRAVVARRALQEIVRDAATGSYGVTGLTEPTLWAHVRARLGMGSRAIHVTVRPVVAAEVWLTVAYGVPVAEVARQVDSAVRYSLRHYVGADVKALTIHVDGLRYQPAAVERAEAIERAEAAERPEPGAEASAGQTMAAAGKASRKRKPR
jgi:uncharacterized alkaline shock family protein YloU